jgi:hypothetical protein
LWKPKISDARGQEEARISNRFTTILDPVSAKNQIIGQRGDNTEIHLKTKDGIHARYRKDSGSHSMPSANSRTQIHHPSLKKGEPSHIAVYGG